MRHVEKDLVLAGKYRLGKDVTMLAPMAIINKNLLAWGAHTESFEPQRFLTTLTGGAGQREGVYGGLSVGSNKLEE